MRTELPAASVRNILSINFNHDGAAVLLSEGRMAGFVTTERYSRRKKHPGLRADDLAELLDQAGLVLSDVDHVLLCNLHNMDSPDIALLHGSDLKETWLEFWVDQRQARVDIDGTRLPCTVNPQHHLLHAAASFYTSPFDSAVSVAIDPLGCRAFLGRGTKLYPLRRDFDTWFNANVGYCYVAERMFGSSIVGAGKVMGLAPYGARGEPEDPVPATIKSFDELAALADRDPVPVKVGDRELNARLAYYVQRGLDAQMLALFGELGPITARNRIGRNLCLSGGTSLNVVATEPAFEASEFERVHFHPACGDDGTAIGAALWYWHHVLGHPRRQHHNTELMYAVRRYSAGAEERALREFASELSVETVDDYTGRTAALIADGAVVGWFEGAGEIGPRALGHRSILADPRSPTMRDRLNREIKLREHFRPFAPAVLNERATEWFGFADSPFMLRAAPVRKPTVPAVTHVDGTARLQTVRREDNPAYYDVIAAFEARTGVPLLLNTSLNTKGEPIAETPRDAVRTLLDAGLDHLVLPHTIISRRRRA
ncbi:carbamoyltransferase C-terminal domain-containing protein [Streptomyces pinistramenti]|uniref:carbamoyltransferase C-terminal domain-containing protein n=1 Tax=Streptomyces pinistramenti TaxID=2884812 RepID=UPI001D099659|nr:carbamoyltransferase C-terminal domain-containing protein [Streptomyces pinistramenti]MCB5909698.1 carbamoyltransferase [Streptomyces pinistramenti]